MAVRWSNWASLGKPRETELGKPFVQHNRDGRLEVFALGSGSIFNIWQVFPNDGWHETWLNMGRPPATTSIRSFVVGRNADGRQEIFAVGDDHVLWQKWQEVPDGGWSTWKSLGSPTPEISLTDRFTVGSNQDGRQEVFVDGSDGNVWQIWQTALNGGWSDWGTLGQPPPGLRPSDRITVGSNADGRQELFVMGGDDAVWHLWQVAPNVGWADWESLGKPRDRNFPEPKERDLSEPLVQENPDGHLEVFAPGNGAFCNRWQEAPNSTVWRHQGWNAKPQPRPDVGIIWLEATLDTRRRRVEVLALGDDVGLWHAWQIFEEPFWSSWHSLEAPSVGIRAADRLTVGTNEDARLEAFLVGEDGAVWHIWQTH